MYTVSKNTKIISYVLMAIGLLAVALGFINDAHRAWPSLMVNNYFFLAISFCYLFYRSSVCVRRCMGHTI